ncbi:MAG: S9 family peptidase, partial [Sphingomonadales bacterium]
DGAGAVVMVGPVDGSAPLKAILSSSGKPDRLQHCAWSSATRLVCSVFLIETADAIMSGFSRLVALDADGTNLKQLSARATTWQIGASRYGGEILDWLPEDAGSAVLMQRTFVAEESTGRLVAQQSSGLGVERVDTLTLKRTTVERPRNNAYDFLTDGHGNVRVLALQAEMASGYNSNRLAFQYRPTGSRDWKPLAEATITAQGVAGFRPSAVDRTLDIVYGFANDSGRTAVYKIALDGSLKRELVFQHDQVDVDSLIRIGRQRRVVGVSYATDKRRSEFFDPQLKALSASLSKALPGLPLITFVDASEDEQKLLLFAGSDKDAGRYYLLDRASKQMGEISPVRPALDSAKLAAVTPVSFPAADGTMIPGYLTLPAGSDGKGLPAIVMPHGGPGARDEWGFDWLAQFYAARGFAVLQPNFRGSSGYGDAWFQKNGFQSWRTAVGDVNDGGRWLEKQGIAAPGKLAIVGWSYGGYAALQSAVLDPALFKA